MEKINFPIYIIGMPLSGKSTIARILSKELQLPYLDLDHEIEKTCQKTINQIFDFHGETYFRSLETEHLQRFKSFQGIIACGGGIVLNDTHKDIMHDGYVIFIDTQLKHLNMRLSKRDKRPLLKTQSLEKLYQERYRLYQSFASITIKNDHTIESLIESLKTMIKEHS